MTKALSARLERVASVMLRSPTAAPMIDRVLEEERARGRGSFYEFVKMAWPVVEPNRVFVDGWHIRAICAHLQAVSEGQIRNLIINIPPRHMKSTLVCVLWPAWEWISKPGTAYLTSAYADRLSIRDAVKTRRVITSLWYRERWGGSFLLSGDQNAKTRYDNDKGGYRIATSVQGLGTGEGGDRVIVDDPHNVLQAESEAVRNSTVTWWDETMSSRLNDPKTGAFVIVMQRVHFQDLTGHCLEQGGYVHLCLPAEHEKLSKRAVTSSAPEPVSSPVPNMDLRKQHGELLWPARFGTAEIAELKRKLGSYAAAAQLQQTPIPAAGGLWKLEWFDRYHTMPASGGLKTVSVDCANKAKELSAYNVFGAFLEPYGDNRAFLADVVRERWEYPDLKRNFISFCQKHQPHVALIEDKGNGTALIQDLHRDPNFKWPIVAIEPEGDKVMRAQRTAPVCEAKLLVLPAHAPWLGDFELELTRFPLTDYLDQVDMLTQYLDRFGRSDAPGFASSGERTMTRIDR